MSLNPASRIRQDVQSMQAYAIQDSSGMVKLDAMENPHRLPPELQAELGRRLGSLALNRYPDGRVNDLRSALAEVEAELRGGISPRISPFPELRDGAALLQRAGFALPVADAEDMALRYKSAFGIFADLRAAGEANAVLARDGRTPPRALFPMLAARLGGAEVDLPLRLLVLTGWAPSPTQQKPARPGSATARLADALGAAEISTGEKAGKPQ